VERIKAIRPLAGGIAIQVIMNDCLLWHSAVLMTLPAIAVLDIEQELVLDDTCHVRE
jgi:hypothetical protein